MICLVIVLLIALKIIQNSATEPSIEQIQVPSTTSSKEEKERIITEISVIPPNFYNDKTKEEILEVRKEFVKISIFKDIDYTPSEYALGQIESNKPWISTNVCNVDGHANIDGESEESRFLNNPSVLVAFDFPYRFDISADKPECTDYKNNLMPVKIEYEESEKTLTVKFEDLSFETPKNKNYLYQLKAINAVDFGYKYAYIDKTKSDFSEYLYFTEENNITNQITELKDYIHLGNSCGVEGGCNNGSPNQPMLQFKLFPYENRPNKDTVIYIKFWKAMPQNSNASPDFVEKIIIMPDVE